MSASSLEYAILLPDGNVLDPTSDRQAAEVRLRRYRDTWPNALLVERVVTYSCWTTPIEEMK